MRHVRVYRVLRKAGHSPQTALRVLVDARRGNNFAVRWIRMCRRATQRTQEN